MIVHVRINDAATQRPTPVRLRISGPDGTAYPPLGQPAEFAVGRYEDVGGKVCLGRRRWWNIDGACEMNLPTGVPLVVESLKGLEYRPLQHTVTLGAGQITLRLNVERVLTPTGWYAGDGRCHARSPHAAALDGAAEGLHFVNLLAKQVSLPSATNGQQFYSVPELSAFSGQESALVRHGCTVVGNTLNTHTVLGNLALWHCHRPVYPLQFGPPDGTDDWSLSDWADQCHRKRGLVVWSDWYRTLTQHGGGSALAALVLGQLDALELTPTAAHEATTLHAAGLAVPIVGASGSDNNRVPVGALRTYAQVPADPQPVLAPGGMQEAVDQPLTYTAWVNSIRAGRCFVTNGPLLDWQLMRPDWLILRANCVVPFDSLEVVANGQVIAQTTTIGERLGASMEVTRQLPASGIITIRCRGKQLSPLDEQTPVFARSAPIRIGTLGPSAASMQLAEQMERVREWVTTEGQYEQPRFREQLLATLTTAQAKLRGTP